MSEWNKADGYRCNNHDNYSAVVRTYQCLWRRLKAGEIGVITFFVNRIGTGIVSHEMNHATLFWWWGKFKDLRKLSQTEYREKLAILDGELNRQFWGHWWRLEKAKKISKFPRSRKVVS
jgi:hypothetical protein